MVVSSGHCRYIPKVRNLFWCRVLTSLCVVSELEAGVVSPRPNGAVTCNRETETLSRGNFRHACGQSGNLDRSRMCLKGHVAAARTQLPVEVNAPGPNRPIVFPRETELLARGDARNVRKTSNLHGRRPIGDGAVSELACPIGADSPDGFV